MHMRFNLELPKMTFAGARAAIEVMRRSYGWAGVFRWDDEVGGYKFLGKNPYEDVPLRGKMEIKAVTTDAGERWPCALVIEIEAGVDHPTELQEIAFLNTQAALAGQLRLSIEEVTGTLPHLT